MHLRSNFLFGAKKKKTALAKLIGIVIITFMALECLVLLLNHDISAMSGEHLQIPTVLLKSTETYTMSRIIIIYATSRNGSVYDVKGETRADLFFFFGFFFFFMYILHFNGN